MDATTLASILASADQSELLTPLTSKLDDLNSLAVSGVVDKKSLVNLLKDAGCAKMGTRQKLAAVLMIELEKYSQPVAPSGAVDWGSLINNDDADDFGIPQPISAAADAAILSKPKAPPASAAVAPLPP